MAKIYCILVFFKEGVNLGRAKEIIKSKAEKNCPCVRIDDRLWAEKIKVLFYKNGEAAPAKTAMRVLALYTPIASKARWFSKLKNDSRVENFSGDNQFSI